MFDLRRRGKVSRLAMVGTSGDKFPPIRKHFEQNISQVYNNLDVSFSSLPLDSTLFRDPEAYTTAIKCLADGDAITIFTPDDTHFRIALFAIEHGIHVLITKPAVKTFREHMILEEAARKHNVLVYIEHHKRFDPAYADARSRAKSLGDFSYFYSYMSQPKSQLETFKLWAGKSSDISYYLNSHHIDICCSMVPDHYPVKVAASGSTGIAEELGCVEGTEDTVTLLVEWESQIADADRRPRRATSVFTASWTAPLKAGVHSQQYFHYMASQGEIRIDQAKRGYEICEDDNSSGQHHSWVNPFYMKYSADEEGNFNGQGGYGYVSLEKFIDAVTAIRNGKVTVPQLDDKGLPTLRNTRMTTAILEAGRRSLDLQRPVLLSEIMEEFVHGMD